MGKKNDGGCGLFCYLIIGLALLLMVDYIGMFNVPVIHQIDEQFVHPKLDPKLMPVLQNIGLIPSFPTTYKAIQNAGVSGLHSVTGGHFNSEVNGNILTLRGGFTVDKKIIEGTPLGVAEIVTLQLPAPNNMIKNKLGESLYGEYQKVYNETNGNIILIYYTDELHYKVASAGASMNTPVGNVSAGVNSVIVEGVTLKLSTSDGYKYIDFIRKVQGKVAIKSTGNVVIFERVGNKWLKMGSVPSTVAGTFGSE